MPKHNKSENNTTILKEEMLIRYKNKRVFQSYFYNKISSCMLSPHNSIVLRHISTIIATIAILTFLIKTGHAMKPSQYMNVPLTSLIDDATGVNNDNIGKFKLYKEDKFFISFPSDAIVQSADNTTFHTNTYQSSEIIGEGFIQYFVAVNRTNDLSSFTGAGFTELEFLNTNLKSRLNSFGSSAELISSEYIKFTKNHNALQFKLKYSYKGIPIWNQGVIIVYNNISYSVSISYTGLNDDIVDAKYSNYIISFAILN